MNIVIIEDERLTAEDLKDVISQVEPEASVVAVLHSVNEATQYFRTNPVPDLIFSDIQLGDGLSFEIFQTVAVKAPIIFCTAYDEYTMHAFKANGIHYILKPFDEQIIIDALSKYKALRSSFTPAEHSLSNLIQLFQQQHTKSPALLVHHKDKIIPVKLEEIAVCYIRNEITHIYTFTQKTYLISKTLEEIQQMGGNMFYRANRQYVINREAVLDASQYLSRKVSVSLKVPFEESITVSKEKMPHFLDWLAG